MKTITSLLFLCLTFSSLLHCRADADHITKECEGAEDKDLCISSMKSLRDSETATPPQLGLMALRLASDDATETTTYLRAKLRGRNMSPAVEDLVEDCSKNYLDAVEQLNDSLAALLDNSYADVDSWVDAAMSAAENCHENLLSEPGKMTELLKRTETFIKLCKHAIFFNNKLDALTKH